MIAHDCGRMINPTIVDGQILGGAAHGIGNALFEWMGFDDDGQPVTTSFGEYLLPSALRRAADRAAAPWNCRRRSIRSASRASANAACCRARRHRRAIEDALSPFGAVVAQAPIRPHEIVALVNRSRSSR